MFTSEQRERVRGALISSARTDGRIAGIALTGSAALEAEDRWSDIDLAFGLGPDADISQTISDWTAVMYRDHAAVHHLDVTSRGTVYRVFLLASTLQVDLAFAPAAEFGGVGPAFRLLAGTAAEQAPTPVPDAGHLIGMGWLYALHARSSIARGRVWQAEYMISGVRDQVLALACLRHDLPAVQGRGIDRLPAALTAALSGALVRMVDVNELTRALAVATRALLTEIEYADADLARRVGRQITELS